MKTLQKKRLKFLNETIKTYSPDPAKLRRTDKRGTCKYAPSKISPGCAIGRHLDVKLARELDKVGGPITSAGTYSEAFHMLPEELQELGQDFLHEIQWLHDNANNWSDVGLSELGKETVKKIKEKYCK